MKRTERILAATVLCLSTTGCLEFGGKVSIAADGSGTQSLHLEMDQRVLQSVRTSARAMDASAQRADPIAAFDAATVRSELEAQGLAMTAHKAGKDGLRETVDVSATFDSIATLDKSTLFGPGNEWFFLAGRNPGNLRLVYYPRGHAAWLAAKERAKELRTQPTAVQKQFFATQKQRLQGLDVEVVVELPGVIDYTSSNVQSDGARTATFRVDPASIASAADLVMALAPRCEIEFSGRGCTIPLAQRDPGVPDPPQSKPAPAPKPER